MNNNNIIITFTFQKKNKSENDKQKNFEKKKFRDFETNGIPLDRTGTHFARTTHASIIFRTTCRRVNTRRPLYCRVMNYCWRARVGCTRTEKRAERFAGSRSSRTYTNIRKYETHTRSTPTDTARYTTRLYGSATHAHTHKHSTSSAAAALRASRIIYRPKSSATAPSRPATSATGHARDVTMHILHRAVIDARRWCARAPRPRRRGGTIFSPRIGQPRTKNDIVSVVVGG